MLQLQANHSRTQQMEVQLMNSPSEDSKTHNWQYGASNVKAQYYFDSFDTFCDEVKEGVEGRRQSPSEVQILC